MLGWNRARTWRVALLALLPVAGCSNETGNRPPVISSVIAAPAQVAPGATISVAATATDPDGDALKYEWVVPAGWTVLGDATTATIALTAPADFASPAIAIVKVSDGNGGSAAGQAAIGTQTGPAPTFTSLSASPNPVLPGGQVALAAAAEGAPGATMTYTWESSDPAWTITGTDAAVTMTAPSAYGAHTAVTVTADDGQGHTAATRLIVSTDLAQQPFVSAITATPNPVEAGGTLALVADVANPSGLALQYAWAAADPAWTVTGTGPTATATAPQVDGVGTTVSLTITDAAGGTATASVPVVTAGWARPVADIAGTSPLQGVVNAGLALDGSASASPAGHPLRYTWQVTNQPIGSTAAFVDETGADNPYVAMPVFFADRAGSYDVSLMVEDAQAAGRVDYAVTSVVVAGPGKVTIVSGDAQTGTVARDLTDPLVVKVTTAADQPVRGVVLGWRSAGGMLFFGSALFSGAPTTTTDADGLARATVRPGRIAGAGTVTAYLVADPTVKADLTFTGAADAARYLAVGVGAAAVTDGLNATVQVVDQFGNPATDHADANTAKVRLALWSPSGNARFNQGGTLTTSLEATLANGSFAVPISDDLAESLQVTLSRGGTGYPDLTFAGWQVTVVDGLETGLGGFATSAPWALGRGAANAFTGVRSLTADLQPTQVVTAWAPATARRGASVAAAANPMTRVELRHKAQVPALTGQITVGGAVKACTFQPQLRLSMYTGAGAECPAATCGGLPPLAGYPVVDLCDAGGTSLSSFGSTTNWVPSLFDVTDATRAGYDRPTLRIDNPSFDHNAALPATWQIDDFKVTTLVVGTTTSALAAGQLVPGPTTKVQFAYSNFTAYQVNACPVGTATDIPVEATLVDVKGNVTQDSETALRIAWNGSATTAGPTVGTIISESGPLGLDLRFAGGRASFVLHDAATETIALRFENLFGANGIDATHTSAASFPETWVCHDAYNASNHWADATAVAPPFTVEQALKACRATMAIYPGEFPLGNCVVSLTYPNTVTAFDTTNNANYYWAYGSGSFAAPSPACRQVYDATPACAPVAAPVCAAGYVAGNAWADVWTAAPTGTNAACGLPTGYTITNSYGLRAWK
ncbi:MAG TPA: hypothetical protein VGQ83_19035 [Polyangia bacterium]|jgi:hypothetical protein